MAPADNLHLAFEDADLVAQHQQLGLIGGPVAKGCEGEVDEEPEADVKDEEEHGRRLIVARPAGLPAWFGWTFGTHRSGVVLMRGLEPQISSHDGANTADNSGKEEPLAPRKLT